MTKLGFLQSIAGGYIYSANALDNNFVAPIKEGHVRRRSFKMKRACGHAWRSITNVLKETGIARGFEPWRLLEDGFRLRTLILVR